MHETRRDSQVSRRVGTMVGEVQEQQGRKGKGLVSRNCCLPLRLFLKLVSVLSPGKARAEQPMGRALQTEVAMSRSRACFKASDSAYTSSTVTSVQRQDSESTPHGREEWECVSSATLPGKILHIR